MKKFPQRFLLLSLCALLGAATPLRAETPPIFDRAQRADGARVVPDKFLRAFDPMTIFFDRRRPGRKTAGRRTRREIS